MPALRPLSPAPEIEVPPEASECKIIATEAGRSAEGLVATLHGGNGTVQVARLVRLADETDRHAFADAVAEATTVAPCFIRDGLLDLVAGVEGALRQAEPGAQTHRPTQATELMALAENVELFHTPDGENFATVTVDDHKETWPLRAKGFREWLAREYYERHEKAPGGQALQDALGTLAGKARYKGPEVTVYTRLAEHDGVIYLDLGSNRWQVVAITTEGWNVVDNPPVKFRRARGMLPLPYPLPGGSMALLEPFVNVEADDDWRLLIAWLVAALRPRGPYPVLVLHGEQGAAKSTTARVLRGLIDPNKAALRSEPREARDLIIAAHNSWVLALDNVSHLSPWLSDALCRLSTGGGFGARELFSDREETLFDAQRPCILNGIEELATRGDLLDRSVILYLPSIAKEQRHPERTFWKRFEEGRARILGALCSVVSHGLQQPETVALDELPRMADFALWVTAAEEALGWEAGTFLQAYDNNRQAANVLALESSPIVEPLTRLARRKDGFRGTATALLTELNGYIDNNIRRQKGWPSTPQGLSGILRRLAPNLRGPRLMWCSWDIKGRPGIG